MFVWLIMIQKITLLAVFIIAHLQLVMVPWVSKVLTVRHRFWYLCARAVCCGIDCLKPEMGRGEERVWVILVCVGGLWKRRQCI